MTDNDIELICSDAIKALQKLNDNSIDLIIADPPYNLGKDYGNNSDNQSFDDYIKFTKIWLSEANRVLKPTGTIYSFMGVQFISHLFNIMSKDCGLSFNSWITWYYTQGIGRTKGFSPRHEDILMFTKSDKYTFNLDAVRVPQKYYRARNNMRGANPGDVWEFSHIHYCNQNRQKHPTQKPEGLIERMVLASSNEGDIVLDPFVGSGTTMRVCQQTNRKGIGIDLNPDYITMSQNRLNEPFACFDSVDSRMERVPSDLNDPQIRKKYLKNHEKWFLKNHTSSINKFKKSVEKKYPLAKLKQKQLFN